MSDLPKFVHGNRIAEQLGVPVDALYKASDAGQFARYYVFGRRRYYLPDEVAKAIKELVPGDPVQFRRMVASLDAAAPVRARRPRREARGPKRGSSEATA